MKTRILFFSIFTLTLFAIGVTIMLLFNRTPSSAGLIAALFSALFVSLAGLFFFSFLTANYIRYRATPAWQSTAASGRWAALIAAFLTLALLLRSFRLWNIATGLVLAVILVVLDLLWRRRGQLTKPGPNPQR